MALGQNVAGRRHWKPEYGRVHATGRKHRTEERRRDGTGVRGRTEVLRQGRSRTGQRTTSQVSAAVVRRTARERGPERADKDGRHQGRRQDRLSWYVCMPQTYTYIYSRCPGRAETYTGQTDKQIYRGETLKVPSLKRDAPKLPIFGWF